MKGPSRGKAQGAPYGVNAALGMSYHPYTTLIKKDPPLIRIADWNLSYETSSDCSPKEGFLLQQGLHALIVVLSPENSFG